MVGEQRTRAGQAGKRRRVPRAEREEQMLAVAEQVFAERGYQAASMDEIAERVGVSKPMLYEYFGSKDGLLLACVSRARTELLEATRRATSGAATPEEMLGRGLLAFFRFIDAHSRAWLVLLHEALITVGPAAEEIEAIRRQQTDLIATLLAPHFPTATARELDAYAQIIVGACERLAVWRERHPDVTPEEAARHLMDLTWLGLAGLISRHGARPHRETTGDGA